MPAYPLYKKRSAGVLKHCRRFSSQRVLARMTSPTVFYQGPVVTREEALSKKLTYYFTGISCRNGHIDERITISCKCRTCLRAARIKERQRNLARYKNCEKTYRHNNKEKISARDKAYRDKKLDHIKVRQKLYYQKNKENITNNRHNIIKIIKIR
jgi:hypothetical protein